MTKRFWRAATATNASVLLDGKPLRLPSGAALRPSTPALASAIAAEWDAAPETFGPNAVPLTGLAGALQERVAPNPAATASHLATYAQADALCYRAAYPPDLAQAQQTLWQPWLNWAGTIFGATLHVTTGVVHIAQPEASLHRLHAALDALPITALAALGAAIPLLGSCVLGLALAHRAITPDAAFEAAMLDELYQLRRWGPDPAITARHTQMRAELEAAARFMELCAA